jgi:transketolase
MKLADKSFKTASTRDGYGEALLQLGETNPDVFVLTGDLADSTRVVGFAEKFPDRFIECGVAEQNMMGIAAGLAANGKIPFVSSYAAFSPGRNWDQMRVSVAISNLNVKIVGSHTGVSVGPDGATHQALEDIAITRVLPNMVVVAPCDAVEAKKAVLNVASLNGPCYVRLTREKTPIITTKNTPFEIGKAEIFWESRNPQVAIVACGPLVHEALLAAEELERGGIGSIVVNNHTIKPIDQDTLISVARKTGAVVTVEEHQVSGGMGSAVAEVLSRNHPVYMEFIGVQDLFGESGDPDSLLSKYGLKSGDILVAARKIVARKNS